MKSARLAILFRACCMALLSAAALPVAAQTENGADITQSAQVRAEARKSLAAERAEVEKTRKAAVQACAGRFAVTDCDDAANDAARTRRTDIQRQELVLKDAERKERGAERQRDIDRKRAAKARELKDSEAGGPSAHKPEPVHARGRKEAANAPLAPGGASGAGAELVGLPPAQPGVSPAEKQAAEQKRSSDAQKRIKTQQAAAQRRETAEANQSTRESQDAQRSEKYEERKASIERRKQEVLKRNAEKKPAAPLPVTQ